VSLRMNLYGWSQPAFTAALGSKDAAVLEAATARLSETLPKEPGHSRARAWLRTLVESGFPLRQDREPPAEPADGGLLTVRMETEVHVFAAHCLARAVARDDHLDLAGESSNWKHPAVGSLYQELAACGFTRSKGCCREYFSWMARLMEGSPLFGDAFRTQWSFYSLFSNQELAAMIPVLQAAAEFTRPLPAGCPEEIVRNTKTSLSEGGKGFVADLIRWFGQIQRAGQDAFILWW
jgi:hypothetical protein